MTSEINQTEELDLGQEEIETPEAPEGFDMDMSLAPNF